MELRDQNPVRANGRSRLKKLIKLKRNLICLRKRNSHMITGKLPSGEPSKNTKRIMKGRKDLTLLLL